MSVPELVVLIGIIAVFTTFAAVLAWVSWADGERRSKSSAVPAQASERRRGEARIDHLHRASSA